MSIRLLQNIAFQNPNLWELTITNAPPEIRFYVTETNIPFKQFEMETRNTGTKHYTKFVPEGDITMTFRETVRWEVYNFLQLWQNEFYDNINKVFRVGAKKRDSIIIFQHSSTPLTIEQNNKFILRGLQLKGIGELSINYENTGPLLITATFSVDEIIGGKLDDTQYDEMMLSILDAKGIKSVTYDRGLESYKTVSEFF